MPDNHTDYFDPKVSLITHYVPLCGVIVNNEKCDNCHKKVYTFADQINVK